MSVVRVAENNAEDIFEDYVFPAEVLRGIGKGREIFELSEKRGLFQISVFPMSLRYTETKHKHTFYRQ